MSADKKTLQKGKDVKIIHIPLGVERIKDKAFESLNHIKEVIVSEGVKEIGAWAFIFSSVEKIVIPSTVEKIGKNAFYFCENLKEVVIKDWVKSLGVGMFSSCDLLENVSLPSTLTSIPDSCFRVLKVDLEGKLEAYF